MAKKPRIEGTLDFDLDQIERPEISPHQEKEVGVLAESIRSHGLLQPIGIRLDTDTGLYEIIWGLH